MPTEPTQVTPDDLFDVLARLGMPAVFLPADDRPPGPDDMPQLIGVLAAAVDRLAIAHQVPARLDRMRAWAAGYLQSNGAGTPCGSRTTFDILTVRLQLFEVLYEGLATGGPTADLLRVCLGAASCYAVAGATAHAVRAGLIDGNAPAIRELSRRQIADGHALITEAAALEARLRASLSTAGDGTQP